MFTAFCIAGKKSKCLKSLETDMLRFPVVAIDVCRNFHVLEKQIEMTENGWNLYTTFSDWVDTFLACFEFGLQTKLKVLQSF